MAISKNGSANGIVHFNEFELDNGLRVILSKDSSIPSIVINLCYHVGSKDEEPDKTGFAHLFEHLMFEGSKNVPPGEYDHIENASINDIRNFYYKYYVPNNAVLTIVGDIDIEETKELVNKYFGSIPRGKSLDKNGFKEEMLTREERKVIYDHIQLPGLFMGYKIPEETAKDFYVMDVLSDILSSGDSSRFYNDLVYEKQIANEIGCYVDAKE